MTWKDKLDLESIELPMVFISNSEIELLGLKHLGSTSNGDYFFKDGCRVVRLSGNRGFIIEKLSRSTQHVLFQGKIKNLSELKRLLRQVGI